MKMLRFFLLALLVACGAQRSAFGAALSAGEELFNAINAAKPDQVILDLIKRCKVKDLNAQYGKRLETPLISAADRGNKKIVEALLRSGANANAKDLNGKTPLYRGVTKGGKDLVELLLRNGVEVNEKDSNGNTPLLGAVARGNKGIVEVLLRNGADVNEKDRYGNTPLHRAVNQDNQEIVAILLSNGADANAKGKGGETPLDRAKMIGNKATIALLSKNLVQADKVLLLRTKERESEREVAKLSSEDVDINAKDKDGNTALHIAVAQGNKKEVEVLLSKGADVNAKDKLGNMPLHRALARRSREIIELLLSRGAHVNAKDQNNNTALHRAVVAANRDLVEVLLSYGADANTKGKDGDTPLGQAVEKGYIDIIALLLSNKFCVDNALLARAKKLGNKEVIALLSQDKGPDIDVKNQVDEVLLPAVEKQKESEKEAAELSGSDADINTEDSDEDAASSLGAELYNASAARKPDHIVLDLIGRCKVEDLDRKYGDNLETSLFAAAAEQYSKEVIKALLAKGANVNIKSANGAMPIDMALKDEDNQLVLLLLDKGLNVDDVLIARAKRFRNKEIVALLSNRLAQVDVVPFENLGEDIFNAINAVNSDNQVIFDLIKRCKVKDLDRQFGKNSVTPLVEAVNQNNKEVIGALLARGASANARISNGRVPIHFAVMGGDKEIALLLLSNGANANALDPQGRTPLHEAVEGRNKGIIEALLNNGADVKLKDENGETPLDLAIMIGDEEAILLLSKKPAQAGKVPASAFEEKESGNEAGASLRESGELFGGLKLVRKNTLQSPQGIIYGNDKRFGNALIHVLSHMFPRLPYLGKDVHSIFNLPPKKIIALIDEAWAKKGKPKKTDPATYVVNMARKIGTKGETAVTIIVREAGTADLVTAYPTKLKE